MTTPPIAEKKAREFWIKTAGDDFSYWNTEISDDKYCLIQYEDFKEAMHVIEYSAYQELERKLSHRHILGKSYEVSAESINKLAGELDEVKAKLKLTEQTKDHFSSRLDTAIAYNVQLAENAKNQIDEITRERDRFKLALEKAKEQRNEISCHLYGHPDWERINPMDSEITSILTGEIK
jgi:chromosome segregation ATPase